ncbi:hypothetical protein R6Q57_017279 [Mikania cordata]
MKGIERLQKLVHGYHSVGLMLVMVVMMVVVCFNGDSSGISAVSTGEIITDMEDDYSFGRCDFFNGSWVYDNETRPLYKERECSFMADDYSCEKFGRNDFEYQFWKWQPHGCDLPSRFNGTALLEKLRDKRVVFVGDSLGKNHWISLLCLLDSWILEPSHKVAEWHGSLITFKASEYNVSIDFYWEPLLVESNCDDPVKHRVRDRIMKIESIESHAKQWINADILIFDSYTWWLEPNMTLLSGDWGKRIGENCYNETMPITEQGYWGKGSDIDLMRKAQSVVQDLEKKGLHIQLLNITQLSQYRKDGHPSIHKRHWVPPTKLELANPVQYADCVHWCLPGVPDVWNEILYAYIRYKI